MESILSGMGLDFEKKNDTSWRVDLNGKKVLLIMGNDNTDAQLYIGFGDTKVSASKMNDGTRTTGSAAPTPMTTAIRCSRATWTLRAG